MMKPRGAHMDTLLQKDIERSTSSNKLKKSRQEIASKVIRFEEAIQSMSQRRAAALQGTARTTLLYWRDRKNKIDLPKRTVDFFESLEGCDFLHRLVAAIIFVIGQLEPCGIRAISLLFKLSRLDYFVGSSYGSIQKLNLTMEKDIIAYEKEERKRLSKQMPVKEITTCQDETFHPEPCLVAIEPVSNFIIVEQYSEKRDSASWSLAMDKGLEDLSVKIYQSTSDEGKGLVSYVIKKLGVHHSPDLFHVLQEFTKATAAPLSAHIRKSENAYENSHIITETLRQERIRNPMNVNELDKKIEAAALAEATCLLHLEESKKRKESVSHAKRGISVAYHPFDLKSGKRQKVEEIDDKLEEEFKIIKAISTEAGLSENSHKRLEKAHRVFKKMVETIKFFWTMVSMQIKKLQLSTGSENLIYDYLLPKYYLQIFAKKVKTAKQSQEIFTVVNGLKEHLEETDTWQNLDPDQQQKMETVAKKYAHLFQRSSSCVEGRNGQLSLWHHGLHKLRSQKLKALTILHNYYIRKQDETTPAELFFERKPKDLFEYLLALFPYPARPKRHHMLVAA
jgi:Family of unknown function (DUF6399)